MANSDLLNLSYHSTGKFATEPPSRAINMRIKITQRGRDAFGSAPSQGPKAAKFAVLIPGPGIFVNVRLVSRVVIAAPSETTPVSPCVPLCAIFLRKPSVYPLSLVKANMGHLCERLKNTMKSGLEQRCDGNFWTIFAGTVLGEKPNFLSRIFGR